MPGEFITDEKIKKHKSAKNKYPVYSSQTLNNGIRGYYEKYSFENAIIYTTRGSAGKFHYKTNKFFCTALSAVLIGDKVHTNFALAEILDKISDKYVVKNTINALDKQNVLKMKFFIPKENEISKINLIINVLNNLITLHRRKEKT
ncbi:restriction endonuclease subunit S [Mycoplasmopsis synoviae]|uniref:Restriction endonuclease S subunits n=1 Tax=Mycoplasmopsis synoviae TaxID=2109 RepID=A0A3B0PWC1_MYCSY|nr:restriction endonuclease subunit S [Mycoplasmopsis synoviae]SYV93681.1 Restriction endonuclease S subunits [Mycoplasmopsis synoviae]